MSSVSRRRFLGLMGAGLAASVPAGVFAATQQPTGFVMRSGAQYALGGRPWVLHGASSYGTSNPGGTGTIDGLITLALGAKLNAIRIVNFFDERGLTDDAPYDASSWVRVDQILDALRFNGLKAILDLSAYRNHLQNRSLNTGSSVTPYSQDWSSFISFVANRVNTVNGSPYGSDPTIAIISFAGEPNPPNSEEPLKPTTQELTDFYRRVFAQWKAIDSNHLLSSGGLLHIDWEERYGNPNGSGIDWQAIFALADNDVPSIHNYNRPPEQDFTSRKASIYCASIGKPWITEEFGFEQKEGDTTRAVHFRTVYMIQRDPGYASNGAGFWNLGMEYTGEGVEPTTFDVNPSTPQTWAVVREFAPAPPSVGGFSIAPHVYVERGHSHKPFVGSTLGAAAVPLLAGAVWRLRSRRPRT